MNDNTQQESEIRDALRANLHSDEPSEGLLRNLRVAASESVRRAPRWQQRRWVFLGTAAAGAVAIGLTLMPAKATARTFERLIQAAKSVKAYQVSIESNEGGKHESLDIAGIGGRFAMRSDDGTLLSFDSGWLKIYDPEEKVVTRFKLGKVVDANQIASEVEAGISEGLKQADLKGMLQEYERKYGKDHIRISPVRRDGTRNLYSVDLDSPKESERVHMDVDAVTDLPERIVVDERQSDNTYKNQTTVQMKFGDRVDPSMLRVDFPDNVKIVDFDLDAMAGGATKDLDLEIGGKDKGIKLLGKSFMKK